MRMGIITCHFLAMVILAAMLFMPSLGYVISDLDKEDFNHSEDDFGAIYSSSLNTHKHPPSESPTHHKRPHPVHPPKEAPTYHKLYPKQQPAEAPDSASHAESLDAIYSTVLKMRSDHKKPHPVHPPAEAPTHRKRHPSHPPIVAPKDRSPVFPPIEAPVLSHSHGNVEYHHHLHRHPHPSAAPAPHHHGVSAPAPH